MNTASMNWIKIIFTAVLIATLLVFQFIDLKFAQKTGNTLPGCEILNQVCKENVEFLN